MVEGEASLRYTTPSLLEVNIIIGMQMNRVFEACTVAALLDVLVKTNKTEGNLGITSPLSLFYSRS